MSEKVIPAVDEDVGEKYMVQFDLEYREVGNKRWRMAAVNLPMRKGKPTPRCVLNESNLLFWELTPEWFDGTKPKDPKVEFRVVKKEFVVNRTVVAEFSTASKGVPVIGS